MSTLPIEKEKIIAILNYLKEQKCYIRYWYWKDGKEFVEALCGMSLILPKWMDRYINYIVGGGVGPTCGACCGYLSMQRIEERDFVEYVIIPCYCHPWGDVTINIPLEGDVKEYAKKIADDISYY
jgi:hypothetical protein